MKTIEQIMESSKQREALWEQTGSLCREPVAEQPSFLSYKRILASGSIPFIRIADSRSGVPKYHPVLLDEKGEECFQLLQKDMARDESLQKALREKKLPKFKNRKLIRELKAWENDYNVFLVFGGTNFVDTLYRAIVVNGAEQNIPEKDRQGLYESYLDFVPKAIRKRGETLAKIKGLKVDSEELQPAVADYSEDNIQTTKEETENVDKNPETETRLQDDGFRKEPADVSAEAVSTTLTEETAEMPEPQTSSLNGPESESVVKSTPPVIEDGIRFYTEQSFGTAELNAYKAALQRAVLEKTSRAYAIKDMESVFAVTDALLTALQLPTTAREYLSDAMGAIMMISQSNQNDRNNSSVLIQLSQIKDNVFVPCFDFQLRDSFDRDRNKQVATGSLNRSDNEAKEKQKSVMNFDEKAADILFSPIAEKISEYNKPKEPAEPVKPVVHDGYYVGRTDIDGRE